MGILEQLARLEELSYARDREQRQKLRSMYGDIKTRLASVSLQDTAPMVRSRNTER